MDWQGQRREPLLPAQKRQTDLLGKDFPTLIVPAGVATRERHPRFGTRERIGI